MDGGDDFLATLQHFPTLPHFDSPRSPPIDSSQSPPIARAIPDPAMADNAPAPAMAVANPALAMDDVVPTSGMADNAPAPKMANPAPAPTVADVFADGIPRVGGAGPAVKPRSVGVTMDWSGGEPRSADWLGGKKKRGRPRKYDTDAGKLRSTRSSWSASLGRNLGLSDPFPRINCWDFTTHVVIVNAGEDIALKIVSIVNNSQRSFSILSAHGAISKFSIREPGSVGGTIKTYEGRFWILALLGYFVAVDVGKERRKMGSLNVTMAAADGRVIGGRVAGSLVAATPVQVIIGSFMLKKTMVYQGNNHQENASTSAMPGTAPDSVADGVVPSASQARPQGNVFSNPIQAGHQFNMSGDCETIGNTSNTAGWNDWKNPSA